MIETYRGNHDERKGRQARNPKNGRRGIMKKFGALALAGIISLWAMLAATPSWAGYGLPIEPIRPTGLNTDSYFGESMDADGDSLIVGAPQENAPYSYSGAAHVLKWEDGAATATARLVPDDPSSYDHFGASVAISGDRIAIGSPYEDNTQYNSGAVYVFEKSGGSWTQTAKLKASVPDYYGYFGSSVSLDGDTLVVGAYAENELGVGDIGAVYVFETSADKWTQTHRIVLENRMYSDYFGWVVDLHDDWLAVGAPNAEPDNYPSSRNYGSVYLYRRQGNDWPLHSELDGRLISRSVGSYFGYSLVLKDEKLVVTAPGSDEVYTFEFENDIWKKVRCIIRNSASFVEFASAVAVDDNLLLIADYRYNEKTSEGGAFALTSFRETSPNTVFFPADDQSAEHFGASLVIGDSFIAVGAPLRESHTGAVYVFSRTWFEDVNENDLPDLTEDYDGNGTVYIEEDFNDNGVADLFEDNDGNGLEDGFEDLNHNGVLDGFEDTNNNGVPDYVEANAPVSATSHPNAMRWYYDTTFDGAWKPVSGAGGYLWLVDQQLETNVTLSNGAFTTDLSLSYPGLTQGAWYLHVIAVDGNLDVMPDSQVNFRFNVLTQTPAITSSSHPTSEFATLETAAWTGSPNSMVANVLSPNTTPPLSGTFDDDRKLLFAGTVSVRKV